MAKIRVFISSTYYDLKHIRSAIESFIEDDLGYEAILSEKGSIAFNPDIALDESCYKEAQKCDIFVLIVGGRYGSATSTTKRETASDFYERYESITKKEFESAASNAIPTYILVDKGIYAEYDTFKRNRKKTDIEYAHVDSVNIFHFLDDILSKPRNNPVHPFEKHSDIINWLKIQWSGLFKDFLQRRYENKQISNLSEQVKYLSELNSTLKRYMEEIITKVDDSDKGKTLISVETKRLEDVALDEKLKKLTTVKEGIKAGLSIEAIKAMIAEAKNIQDYISKAKKAGMYPTSTEKELVTKWQSILKSKNIILSVNQGRVLLGKQLLK